MWIAQNEQRITDPDAMTRICATGNIIWDRWPVDTVPPAACRQAAVNADYGAQILAAVAAPLDALKAQNGYLTEDIVALSPETPNLDQILAMFDQEHHHTDDEVRVVLYGEGIFGIVPQDAPPFACHVEAGDLLVVPAYTRHWFTLTERREIVALRVFKTPAGWQAIYDPALTAAG